VWCIVVIPADRAALKPPTTGMGQNADGLAIPKAKIRDRRRMVRPGQPANEAVGVVMPSAYATLRRRLPSVHRRPSA
jgi:hypothetical protein